MCQFHVDCRTPGLDFVSEVRQDNTFGPEAAAILRHAVVVKVRRNPRIIESAFTDEQIGVLGLRRQIFGPAGISRIHYFPAVHFEGQPERDFSFLMRNSEGSNESGSNPQGHPGDHLYEVESETEFLQRIGIHGFKKGKHSLASTPGTGNAKGSSTGLDVYVLEEEKREPGKVIAVKMAEKNGIDESGGQAGTLEGGEDGGAAVEQKRCSGALDQVGGLTTAAGGKRISGSQKHHSYIIHDPSISITSCAFRWILGLGRAGLQGRARISDGAVTPG
jgi:hypothetical protein